MDFRDSTMLWHNCSSSSTTIIFHSGSTISTSWISAFSKSSVTWNSLPSPNLLLTSIEPPMASTTIYFVIAIPRPVPSVFCTLALSSRLNDSKIFFWYSSDIPIPLSFTRICTRTYSPPLGESSSYKETWIMPSSGVNFTAFPNRLINTWFKRTLSQQTFSVSISWIEILNCWCLERTWGWIILTMLSITSLRETWSIFRLILPLSIFDISNTSLISPSKCLLESMILRRQFFTWSLLSILAVAIAVMPTMAFIGVRISWLIFDKNSLLALFAFSASCLARSASTLTFSNVIICFFDIL